MVTLFADRIRLMALYLLFAFIWEPLKPSSVREDSEHKESMKSRQYGKAHHSPKLPIVRYAVIFLCAALIVAGAIFFLGIYRARYLHVPSMSSVYADWATNDYATVYEKTAQILEKRPMDGTALALHGFAAYYLFAEQTDLSIGADYLTEAVVHLRRIISKGITMLTSQSSIWMRHTQAVLRQAIYLSSAVWQLLYWAIPIKR